MIRFAGRTILLDIEGTTSSISFVHEVLFAFARRELAGFLERTWDEAATTAVRARIAADAGVAEFGRGEIVAHLLGLMDRDAKAGGLKELQGLIWRAGYESGELRSHVFADVPPALREWRQRGIDVHIYSSGSVGAQKLFFAHTEFGDLTPLLCGHFDTTSGSKVEAASYARLATQLGVSPAETLFVSDSVAELDAATATGMRVAWSIRPGNKPATSAHPRISSLAEIDATPGV